MVLSADGTPSGWSDLPDALGATFTKVWLDGQRALAGESTAGRFIEVTGSDHDMVGYRPDAVSDAIVEVLDAAAAR